MLSGQGKGTAKGRELSESPPKQGTTQVCRFCRFADGSLLLFIRGEVLFGQGKGTAEGRELNESPPKQGTTHRRQPSRHPSFNANSELTPDDL